MNIIRLIWMTYMEVSCTKDQEEEDLLEGVKSLMYEEKKYIKK